MWREIMHTIHYPNLWWLNLHLELVYATICVTLAAHRIALTQLTSFFFLSQIHLMLFTTQWVPLTTFIIRFVSFRFKSLIGLLSFSVNNIRTLISSLQLVFMFIPSTNGHAFCACITANSVVKMAFGQMHVPTLVLDKKEKVKKQKRKTEIWYRDRGCMFCTLYTFSIPFHRYVLGSHFLQFSCCFHRFQFLFWFSFFFLFRWRIAMESNPRRLLNFLVRFQFFVSFQFVRISF